MSENKTELAEEFEKIKESEALKQPEKADEIMACSTVKELYHAVHANGDENEGETDEKTPKTLGVVEHVHRMAKEEKEDDDREGSVDLSKTGGQIPLLPTTPKTKTWQSTQQMLDDLFKLEMRGKIEKTKRKPNTELIEKGNEATKMIEKLWDTAMVDTGGQHYIKRAREDLLRGRYTFSEPEWLRDLMNPEGRKHAKRKPFIEEE